MNRRLALGIGTAAAVLAAGAGVVALSGPDEPADLAPAAAGPITTIAPDPAATPPAVRTRIDRIDLTAAASAAGGLALAQRATKPFSMLSVNWTDPAARPAGTLQVRTRSAKTGRWTGWQDLEIAEERADQPAEVARRVGATEPLWAGRSNGVAARLAGTAGLPAGLRLNLIDPDEKPGGTGGGDPVDSEVTPGGQGGGAPAPSTSASDAASPAQSSAPSSAPPSSSAPSPDGSASASAGVPASSPATSGSAAPAPSSTVPAPGTGPVKAQLPPYVSRAGWSADETLVKDEIKIEPQVKMMWVHHTGFRPDYTCAEAPSIVRGIQANDVKNDGLSDMGYNFLVDKCGTLYEGRKGGVDKAVVGAHSVGFNTGSVGIALLGDYTSVQPSEAALKTIGQVAAARLGAYGFSPLSTAQMTMGVSGRKWPAGSTVVFPRIAGHKDGQINTAGQYLTVCPGTKLYALLPAIRARSVISGLAVKSLTGGASVSGTFYARTAVTVNWTVATPSAAIARFELLRDGKPAATPPGTARSATIPLTPGAHTVAVRAVHTSGSAVVTASSRVIADVTAPTLGGPAPALRSGTYSPTAIPVTAHFRAADNARLGAVAATSPARVPLSATSTYWQTSMRPGANTALTVTARDAAGNTRTASVTRRAAILPETAAKRTGTWSTKSGGGYLSGRGLASTRKGSKLTYTFTGRAAALLFSRGTTTGRADVYLDGKKVATIDTRAGRTIHRQAVWVRSLSAARHTVTIVVAGTSRRPTVVSDGLAYIG